VQGVTGDEAHCGDSQKPPFEKESGECDVVRVSGKELGEGLDKRQLREKGNEYAKKNFAGQNVTVLSNGVEILISMGGIRHTLTFAKTRDELYAVVAIPQ